MNFSFLSDNWRCQFEAAAKLDAIALEFRTLYLSNNNLTFALDICLVLTREAQKLRDNAYASMNGLLKSVKL